MRAKWLLVLLAVAALCAPSALLADTTITGEKLGAFFQITVPDDWNGTLVINNHGFDFSPPGPNPGLGALAPLMLAEGYAVAASSYSQCCWTLFTTQQDINRLVGIVAANFGAPDNVILHGGSLGGIVTAQGIEKLSADVIGAYPVCGALSGSRSWDGAIDLRLVYDAVCGSVGVLPGGATGLPAPGFPPGLSTTTIALAVNACTGVLTPAGFRTPAQQARLDTIKSVTQIPESFIVTDMVFVTNGLSNLIFASDKLDGGQGVGNVGVVYNDPTVDAAIQRVAYTQQDRKRLERNFTPKGDVGDTKIVSIHTDGDGLVIVENEEDYMDKVPASNFTLGVVDEAGNSHCGFSEGEIVGGWEALRGWLAGGPQPTAADLQATCSFAVSQGASGPCRIDPGYALGEFDDRIPPR